MSVYEKGLITVLVVHAIFIAIAIPLAIGKVPPNVVYGYRTRRTLSDREVWYRVNAAFGVRCIAACVIAAAALILIYAFAEMAPQTFFVVSLVDLVAPAAIATIFAGRHMNA